MADPALVEYLRTSLEKGYKLQDLKNLLLQQGYAQSQVEEASQEVQSAGQQTIETSSGPISSISSSENKSNLQLVFTITTVVFLLATVFLFYQNMTLISLKKSLYHALETFHNLFHYNMLHQKFEFDYQV